MKITNYQTLPSLPEMCAVGQMDRDAGRKAFHAELAKTGKNLSWEKLREACGGGSNRDVQQLMHELKAEAKDMALLDAVIPRDVAAEFTQVTVKLYRSLKAAAEESINAVVTVQTRKLEESDAHAMMLAGKLDQSEAEVARLTAQVRELEGRLDQSRVVRDALFERALLAETELKVLKKLANGKSNVAKSTARNGNNRTGPSILKTKAITEKAARKQVE